MGRISKVHGLERAKYALHLGESLVAANRFLGAQPAVADQYQALDKELQFKYLDQKTNQCLLAIAFTQLLNMRRNGIIQCNAGDGSIGH